MNDGGRHDVFVICLLSRFKDMNVYCEDLRGI